MAAEEGEEDLMYAVGLARPAREDRGRLEGRASLGLCALSSPERALTGELARAEVDVEG